MKTTFYSRSVCYRRPRRIVYALRNGGLRLVLVLACGLSCSFMVKGEESVPFLTANGNLLHPLELRDAQEGFAGVTGEIWTIEPAGRWRMVRFVNDRLADPYREGELSRKELAILADELASSDFLELPEQLGREVEINRRLVTISFGEKRSTLVLGGGENISLETATGPEDVRASWVRFIALVQSIETLLGTDLGSSQEGME